jgi:hypothetical protein
MTPGEFPSSARSRENRTETIIHASARRIRNHAPGESRFLRSFHDPVNQGEAAENPAGVTGEGCCEPVSALSKNNKKSFTHYSSKGKEESDESEKQSQ